MLRYMLVGAGLLLSSPAWTQASLPPQVQADMLVPKIEAAVKAGNAAEALNGIAQYRELGVKVPPAILFLEAQLGSITKDWSKSKRALDEFLSMPDARADKNYQAALILYPQVEKEAAAAAQFAQQKAQSEMQRSREQCSASWTGPSAALPPGTTFRDCPVSPEMVVIPSGSFRMGSPSDEKGRDDDEGPQHKVNIWAFAIGKYEVTFDEWDACVAGGGCNAYRPDDNGWGRGRRPANNVSWDDAQAYVTWLSAVTGKRYRLLSESEWEYAARAGTTGRFSDNGNETTLCQIANHADTNSGFDEQNTACSDGVRVRTAPVGSYLANAFGLHDMHGNLYEWTQDCISILGYRDAPTDGRPWLDGNCDRRILRGGSFGDIPSNLRSAFRGSHPPDTRGIVFGFRVARTLD